MPNRNFEDSILLDETVNSLSPEAFLLFFRMILIADDFGIVPADGDILQKLTLWPPHLLRKFSGISAEIPEKNLVGLLYHNGGRYYVIKPDSWDRIQGYHIRKRTKSKYLKLPAPEADQVRRQADWPFSEKFSGSSQEVLRNFLTYARARYNLSLYKKEVVSNTPESITEPESATNTLTPSPSAAAARKPVVTQIVDLLQDMGRRTGCDDFAKITHLTWEPKLRREAVRIGYQCLYRETQKFCHWFEGQLERGKLSNRASYNAQSRFFNTWLNGPHAVKPEHWTAGDELWTPEDLPAAAEPSAYSNLME